MEINNSNNIPVNIGSTPPPRVNQNVEQAKGEETEVKQSRQPEDTVILNNSNQNDVSVNQSYSQFKDVYAVSDKVFSLFQINGKQYTRERNLETGEVVYFPKIDEALKSGYTKGSTASRTDFDRTV